MPTNYQLVWFKRDLRLHDHEALARAAAAGPVLPLYIIEPELWQQPDMSWRHYQFLVESLADLDRELRRTLGVNLCIQVGDAVSVLQNIITQHNIVTTWSHQETWNGWTYARDMRIQHLLKQARIPWHEPRQFGIVRRLKDRDGWVGQWNALMSQPLFSVPKRQVPQTFDSVTPPDPATLGLKNDGATNLQPGGRIAGLERLNSFLQTRGEPYAKAMSAPGPATVHCSRLSTHIAYGTLSLREICHALGERSETIKALPRGQKGKWPSAIRSFAGRLRWHCHFMQKLEDEPRVEFENFHSAYDGLRESDHNEAYFEAWATGRTGYPMIDACMRSLIATGWVNFRMRAMLMSFASYHLWLHWRPTSLHLARLFTDYEPGIHYTQCQMQAGTTCINTIRIYNPTKQAIDHDPHGEFIRKWIPELADIPDSAIHQPWAFPDKLNGYPFPIVDESVARKTASARVYALRRDKHYRSEADAIVHKHGSRKSTTRRSQNARRRNVPQQTELPIA